MGDKAATLEAINKEAVDLVRKTWMPFESFTKCFCRALRLILWGLLMQENIPIEKVFENLRCNREGLSSQAA